MLLNPSFRRALSFGMTLSLPFVTLAIVLAGIGELLLDGHAFWHNGFLMAALLAMTEAARKFLIALSCGPRPTTP